MTAKRKQEAFQLNKLEKEIRKKNTTTEKLDYWKSIDDKFINEPLRKEFGDSFLSNIEAEKVNDKLYLKYFGDDYVRTLSLYMPKHIYKEHFENELNNPELTYWFLKYNAEQIFIRHINDKEFQNKINSNLRETFIKADLKKIEKTESKVKELLLNKELDIYKNHRNNYQYRNEVAILRVLDGNYYKENTIGIAGAETEAITYFKHKLLKPYLEKQLEDETKKKYKEFEDHFFNIEKKEAFLRELKTTFNTEKGNDFGILIEELKQNGVLKIGNREFKNFVNKAKVFFNQDIASRIAILKYNPKEFNEKNNPYKKEMEIIQKKLEALITEYKSS